ncbi:MAG: serine O-acetyltransferase [Candidatus Competibacteraceae bacterium]
MFNRIRSDVRAVLDRDPAARSALEVILCYPGLHAVWGHRLTHKLWQRDLRLPARWLSQLIRIVTGIEIHPGARIGPGFFIDHGMGVVIGETAAIGADVTLYHGVTLGGTSLNKGKRHPTLGDRVVVGAGAKLLGPIQIGDDCRIGANAVVVKSVPPNAVVVGVPGQPVVRSQIHLPSSPPDLQHELLPDMIGTTVIKLLERVDRLEKLAYVKETLPYSPRPDQEGAWRGEDFSI